MQRTQIPNIRVPLAVVMLVLLAAPLQFQSVPGYGGSLALRWQDVALVAIVAALLGLRPTSEPTPATAALVAVASVLVLASVLRSGSDATAQIAGFRLIGGLWIARLASTRLRTSEARAVPFVLAIGGTATAALSLVWLRWPPTPELDASFLGSVTPFLYHDRLTRPFAHANTSATYLLTTSVATAWVAKRCAGRGRSTPGQPVRGRVLVAVAGAGLLVQVSALLLTLSRGVSVALVLLGLVGIFAARQTRLLHLRTLAIATLLVVPLLLVLSEGFRTRLVPGAATAEASVAIIAPPSLDAAANPTVTITNDSSRTLPTKGSRKAYILGVWLDVTGTQRLAVDLWPIPEPIEPGKIADLVITIAPPVPVGTYQVAWDIRLGNAVDLGAWGGTTSTSVVSVTRSTVTVVDATIPVISPTRPEIWSIAWRVFGRHPVTGVGPGRLPDGWLEVNGVSPTPVSHAHNQWLEWLATLGLPATAAMLGLVGSGLVQSVRHLRNDTDHRRNGCDIDAVALTMLASMTLAGMVDSPLAAPPLNLIWWLVLGLSLRPTEPSLREC